MILRTLLANFIVMALPLLLIAAGIILVLRSRRASGGAKATFYTGVLLLSLPLGVVVYFASGMIAAILRGEGHFYSVPFGGYSASNDAALLISAIVWIGLVFVGLATILRSRN
jgi:hypothetical protein